MKQYASLPLRATEEVIEEFGVSDKYTYLLLSVGIVLLLAAGVAFANQVAIARLFGGAGALAPLFGSAIWVALGGLGLYVVGVAVYLQLAYKYFLTNQRVIETVGFLAQRTSSSEYGQINDIVVRQDLINRLVLDTGTIGISTPGTAVEEYQLINVDHPVARRELIRSLIRATIQGRVVDKFYLAHLKAECGLAPSEQAALDALDTSVGKDPTHQAMIEANQAAFAQHQAEFHARKVNESAITLPAQEAPSRTAAPSLPSVPSDQADRSSTDDQIEDLLGDGIDDSDRLRAAQRTLDP